MLCMIQAGREVLIVTHNQESYISSMMFDITNALDSPASYSHNLSTLDGLLCTVYILPYTPSISILFNLLYLLYLNLLTTVIAFRHINPNPYPV